MHEEVYTLATDFGAYVERHPVPATGIPFAVKDFLDVAGQTTRNGTPGLGHHVAAEDAEPVARLRAAGYVPVARTTVPELAWSVRTPGCRNPRDPRRDAGGSSGGSAVAVAIGDVPVALGTDTGGSIRIPAALCGVAGLRPTHGTISMRGVTPLTPSMDTVGPIARTAAECLEVHRILGGAVEGAPESVEGLRLGWPEHLWGTKIDPEVLRIVEGARDVLRASGAEIVPVELPLGHRHARSAGFTTMLFESAQLWWQAYQDDPSGLRGRAIGQLKAGSEVTRDDYDAAREHAAAIAGEVDDAFTEVDALLMPTVPVAAALAEADAVEVGGRAEAIENAYYRLTALAAVSGHPALTVPAGLTADGLPVGAQLVGPRRREALLCLLGTTIEGGSRS
ncbi:amidase [Amycolatopsis thermophila]|uniref:Aspartyl-tRNA(Asn)/glutamyl-tRNA(Gln) amidotransferase subunit A n=1 Tax=Amycolatopsis thermophila TaxID=206084 RepID=A0ABU0EMA0_9PSEU|nr:amidase [Amycolatopsis thermophila]MDQ0376414.1 aspartyl-tRNA(Asn)/glutamyl-tRNA(Gln) amidotransferase subunit A [Amycolatopsis thermophila]